MLTLQYRILVAQPRRLTTVKTAEHFALMNATPLGFHVGYQIGGRNMTSTHTTVILAFYLIYMASI